MATSILDLLNAHADALHEAKSLSEVLVDLAQHDSPHIHLVSLYIRQMERISGTGLALEQAVRRAN
jgi:hypothetical protein